MQILNSSVDFKKTYSITNILGQWKEKICIRKKSGVEYSSHFSYSEKI